MGFPLYFDVPPSRGGDEGNGPRRRLSLVDDAAVSRLPHDHPDFGLVEALRAGDMGALETIYTTYAAAIHQFMQGYVSADVADDVVQDVFFTLWRRRLTITIHSSIRAYLFGAARLRALQYRRNAHTHDAVHVRLAASDIDAHEAPSDIVEVEEVRVAVARALMTLPGRTRELLALRWVYALRYSEAAAVLGVSVEAAKKIGRRAELALAPLLERFRV